MRCKYIRKIFQNEENGYTVGMYVGFLKNWDYLHQHIKKT